jgi:hypothetical protein
MLRFDRLLSKYAFESTLENSTNSYDPSRLLLKAIIRLEFLPVGTIVNQRAILDVCRKGFGPSCLNKSFHSLHTRGVLVDAFTAARPKSTLANELDCL